MAELTKAQIDALRTALAAVRLGQQATFVLPRDPLQITLSTMTTVQADAFETALDNLEAGIEPVNLVLPRQTLTVTMEYDLVHAVSGQVTQGGSPVSDAVITFVGADAFDGSNFADTVDGTGRFSINVPNGWSGTVYATRVGSTFTAIPLSNVTAPLTGQNFGGTAQVLRTVSGTIDDGTSALQNVVVSLTGSGNFQGSNYSATTDASGNWSVANVTDGWTGTITPALSPYAFSPTSVDRTSSPITADLPNQDFTGTSTAAHVVSGTVVDGVPAAMAGVAITLTGTGASAGTNYNTTTGLDGTWQASVIEGWSGDIVAATPGYTFAENPRSLSNVTSAQANQDFTGTLQTLRTISGTVTESAGLGSVAMKFRGTGTFLGADFTPQTASNGTFSQTVPNGWTGTLTPERTNYTFSPTSITYSTPVTSDQTAQDFTATNNDPFPVNGTAYYVATTGNDGNTGARGDEFRTIPHALTVATASASAHDAIRLRTAVGTGVYSQGNGSLTKPMNFSNTGFKDHPIIIETDPLDIAGSGKAILDGEGSGTLFEIDEDHNKYYFWRNLIFRDTREAIWFNPGGARSSATGRNVKHMRIEACQFDTGSNNGYIVAKNFCLEYLVIKDCTFVDHEGTEGCVDLKISTDSATEGSGTLFAIIDGCSFANADAASGAGSNQSSGFITQNNSRHTLVIDCTSFDNGEIGFTSKATGKNMYIRNRVYGRSRPQNEGRKAAFYLRGPISTPNNVLSPPFSDSDYLIINNVGITTRFVGGDQGPVRIWRDASVWAYHNTLVSLKESASPHFAAPLTISPGGGGGDVNGGTIQQLVLARNNILYQVDDSYSIVFHSDGFDQGLREYVGGANGSDGNCFFVATPGVGGAVVRHHSPSGGQQVTFTLAQFKAFATALHSSRDPNSIDADPLFTDAQLVRRSSPPAGETPVDIQAIDDKSDLDLTLQGGSPCKGAGRVHGSGTYDYPTVAADFLGASNWNNFAGFDMLTTAEKNAYVTRILTEHQRDYTGAQRANPPSIGAYE